VEPPVRRHVLERRIGPLQLVRRDLVDVGVVEHGAQGVLQPLDVLAVGRDEDVEVFRDLARPCTLRAAAPKMT